MRCLAILALLVSCLSISLSHSWANVLPSSVSVPEIERLISRNAPSKLLREANSISYLSLDVMRRISLGYIRFKRAKVPIDDDESLIFGVGYYLDRPVAILVSIPTDIMSDKGIELAMKVNHEIDYSLRTGKLVEVSITGEVNSYWDKVASELIVVMRKTDFLALVTIKVRSTGLFSDDVPSILRRYGW